MSEPSSQGAPAGPQWRRPLITAAITLVIAIGLLIFGYTRMSDQADDSAGAVHGTHGGVTRAATGSPGASGTGQQPQAPPGGASRSP